MIKKQTVEEAIELIDAAHEIENIKASSIKYKKKGLRKIINAP